MRAQLGTAPGSFEGHRALLRAGWGGGSVPEAHKPRLAEQGASCPGFQGQSTGFESCLPHPPLCGLSFKTLLSNGAAHSAKPSLGSW